MILQEQEISFDHAESNCFFDYKKKRAVATVGANTMLSGMEIGMCISRLNELALEHNGIDRLQVFTNEDWAHMLWCIEDEHAITFLLPSEY